VKSIIRVLAVAALLLAAVLAPPASAGNGISLTLATPYGGQVRTFNLYVAPRVPAQVPVPLLIVLHGLYLDPATTEASSGLDAVADSQDVALVYPAGVGGSWDAGACCGEAHAQRVDDVGFLAALVGLVGRIRPIDLNRVYLAGFSNGGMMALKAACDRPDVFAAAVAVASTLQTPCLGRHPVNALLLNGERDTTIPYDGERYSRFLGVPIPSAPESATVLARRSHCTTSRVSAAKAYSRRQFAGCTDDASVQLLTVPAMGHRWPTVQHDGVDGGAVAWTFLRAQRRLP
jgi:polyhydroxybutyrate depolymerase